MKKHRYSSVQDYIKCPKLYQYKHVDGLDDGMSKLADIAFGSAVHLGIQDLFEGGDGIDIFSTWWEMKKDLEYGRLNHDSLMSIGKDLLAIFRDEHKKKFVPKYLEQKLEADNLTGTVDFVGTYNGVLSVVDWKTAGFPYDSYKIKCNEQMYGYAYMAKKALQVDAKQVVYGVAVKDPKNPRWQFKVEPLTDTKLSYMVDNVKEVCKNIDQDKVFVRHSNACVIGKKVCPFFDKCFKEEK